jgi:hypothetical protein
MKRSKKQGLSKKQKNDLKSLNKLDSQSRATVNYKIRIKLEDALDGLEDIQFMLSRLPREHAKKAVKDNHVAKAMSILLELLDLREFKRVRQNSQGEEGYVIKKFRGRYQRIPLTQKDYNRYIAMWHFAVNFKKYFNPKVVLPGDSNLIDVSPLYEMNDWVWIDDKFDFQTHQKLHGEAIKDIDIPYFETEDEWKQHEDELTRELIQRNIDATNEYASFFKSTH